MRKFKDTTLGIKKPSAWRLDGASVRRAAMTLAAVILTTITAWATGININTGTIADIPDQGYTGSAIVPDITLTVGDKVLTEGTDYTVTCTDNVNVGTATLTATGQGDYTGTLTKNFRIYYADKTGSCVPSSSYDTDVTYTLHDEDQDGHYEQLTISGTGPMIDFGGPEELPWAANLNDITSVTVQSGVTRIGASAFHDCKYLTSVSLPEGLTSIGDRAFHTCFRLPALTVPASVESVGEYAFEGLAFNISGGTLTFASGSMLTSVGKWAFKQTKASVDMSACTGLTAVPSKAFSSFSCDVTFPHSLTSIAASCFINEASKNAKVYVHVPDNYVLTVNGEPISATNGKADITSNIGVGTDHPAVTLSCTPYSDHFSQDGNTYTIHDALGWGIFCDFLQDLATYNRFSGKTVYLANDIGSADSPITRMAGTSQHDFCGTFDGGEHTLYVSISNDHDYTAPFSYVSNVNSSSAAIRNLKVTGTVESSHKFASGLVGGCWGEVDIENCLVSTVINSHVDGDGTHGGIVGRQGSGTVTIRGCVFDGQLLGSSTTHCAGFVGYNNGSTLTISNSLFAPEEFSVSSTNSATFARNWTMPADANCYYTLALGTAQGKEACTAPAAPVGDATHAKYSVSGITPYANGLLRTLDAQSTAFYYSGGDNVSVSYVDESGNSATHDAIALDGTESTLEAGQWYYVGANINYSQTVTLGNGAVTLILADGKTMNIGTSESGINNGGYGIQNGGTSSALTIYGQTLDDDDAGHLYIYMANDGIDGIYLSNDYTQHSGNVTVSTKGNGSRCFYSGNFILHGGTLNATATYSGSDALFACGNVTITGGQVTATGGGESGYGINANNGNGTITLGWTSATDYIMANSYKGTVNIVSGQSFHNGSEVISGTNIGKALVDDKTLMPYIESTTADGTAILYDNDAGLPDGHHNADRLAVLATDNQPHDIMLLGRTLYRDGAWNTLCLPFAMTAEQIAQSPLVGADIRSLSTTIEHEGATTGFNPDNGTLTLNFTPAAPADGAVTAIQAGVPYIVKWGIPDGMTAEEFAAAYAANPDAYDLKNPVFTGVTVTNDAPADHATTSQDGYVTFVGTYSSTTLPGGDTSYLYLGSGNKLYWPSSDNTINAFRAYFHLALDPDTGQGSPVNSVRAFNLNFGNEEETTGIISTTNYTNYTNSAGAGWYDLSGRKLQGKPTAKGVYIYNGKKRVITGW